MPLTGTARRAPIEQTDVTAHIVLNEIAQGVTLSGSGFRAKHAYPERVVKEAIVNAILHRDYRLNRDIFVRVFDDRIEVESPGVFPGNITPASIGRTRVQSAQSATRAEPARISGAAKH